MTPAKDWQYVAPTAHPERHPMVWVGRCRVVLTDDDDAQLIAMAPKLREAILKRAKVLAKKMVTTEFAGPEADEAGQMQEHFPAIWAEASADYTVNGAQSEETPKHESTTQKGLCFWAERETPVAGSGPACWIIYSQAEGFPKIEAFDDWFAFRGDADDMAKELAEGKL